MHAPPPRVELRRIGKRFPGVIANHHVSLCLRAGEVHVLLGENGAGKSTLVAMLAGMQQPDSGEIRIDGVAARIDAPRRALALGIGTVFQHSMLVPSLSVAENLALGGRWWQRPRLAALRARFGDTCADLGLSIDPDRQAGALAPGERQQVEIVRALWRGGRVIVLDEPTAMLTPRGSEALGALMRRMAGAGIAVVFITHRLHEALACGDRISVLRAGRLAGGIDPATLASLPREAARDRIIALMFGADRSDPEAAPPPAAAATASPTVLDVRNLGVGDAAGPGRLAGVSFSVAAGEILGIAGIDGGGQRDLAEALSGQIGASGSVMLDGREIGGLDVAARTRLGLRSVSDDRLGEGTVASFPVSLNLLLKQIGQPPFWVHGVRRRAAIDRHAEALIRAFDIRTPSVGTPVGRLSGGNIQKVVLARELQPGARVVVCSKPTTGLDVRSTDAARVRIRAAATQGVATVLISTDLDEILALSHRIGVISSGRLVGVVANGPHARIAVGRLMADGGSHAH